ncbi:MAG: diguanylate cyclase [Candidatus Omnitrophica bacterium]|nr:diguanylate cyclase [Candidatus Omnitrophota bacterium]
MLRIIMDNIAIGVSLINPKMQIIWVNKTLKKLFPNIDVRKNPFCYRSFYYPPKKEMCEYCPAEKAFSTGRIHSSETGFCRNKRIYRITAVPIKSRNGKVAYVVETMEDITQIKRKDFTLMEEQLRYRTLIEQSLQGIVIACGLSPRIVFANSTMEKIFGYTSQELLSFSPEKVRKLVHPKDRRAFFDKFRKQLQGKVYRSQYKMRGVKKNGEIVWVDASLARIIYQGKPAVQVTFIDITEKKKIQEQLQRLNRELLKSNKRLNQLVLKDSLTGVYNYRYLEEVIEREFYRAKRYGHPFSVIMLDIDYFKSINEIYGQKFGDLILKQVAEHLRKLVRRYDIVVRFAGEGFVIVSSGTDRTTAMNLAWRILDNFRISNFGTKDNSIKLKLSIGVVSYPENSVVKGFDLINFAEKVLSKAKEDGGDRVYSSEDLEEKGEEISGEEVEGKEVKDVEILKEKIKKLTKEANQSLIEAVFAFARTIKLKDSYTGEHVESTVYYATEIARKLGLSSREVEHVRQAAILHDLGKVGISERLLLKNAKFTKRELKQIRKHPQIAIDIIRPIHSLHDIIPFILYHHERWDGKGYPSGLKGEEIPLGARIIAVADVYQALISNRPYRKAYPKKKAIQIIKKGRGTQFDPQVVDAFLDILHKEKR